MTTPQIPLGSPFNAASTASDVLNGLDLSGRTVIVTGGYSGLGLVTSRALANIGAHVLVPARNLQKASAAVEGVAGIELVSLDLTDRASIARFTTDFVTEKRPLHALINNAGIMATPLMRDPDGHEGQFATNHLGHFRLTCGLWPALRMVGARVVSVSSRGHQISGIDFDDVDFKRRPYDKWVAYGQSKTANILFARELDRRSKDFGVRAYSVHPGQILTDLARHLTTEELASFETVDDEGRPIVDPSRGLKTPEQGAATALWCATSSLLDGHGGVYCEDCEVAEVNHGEIGGKGVAPWCVNDFAAERLWNLSVQWTGLDLID